MTALDSDCRAAAHSSPPASASTGDCGLAVCGSAVECLSRKHISEAQLILGATAQFLTPQESSSQSVVDPHSTDACANLAARPTEKGENKWELAPKRSAAMGRTFSLWAARGGGVKKPSLSSTPSSSSVPVCVQDGHLNSASSDTGRSTPPPSLSARQKVVSVNVSE